MIQTDGRLSLEGLAPVDAPSLAAGREESAAPQPFSDFSAFDAGARGTAGRVAASADPAHAARTVAAFVLRD